MLHTASVGAAPARAWPGAASSGLGMPPADTPYVAAAARPCLASFSSKRGIRARGPGCLALASLSLVAVRAVEIHVPPAYLEAIIMVVSGRCGGGSTGGSDRKASRVRASYILPPSQKNVVI